MARPPNDPEIKAMPPPIVDARAVPPDFGAKAMPPPDWKVEARPVMPPPDDSLPPPDAMAMGMPRNPPSMPADAAAHNTRRAHIAAVPVQAAVPVGSEKTSNFHLVVFSAGALVIVAALVAVIVALNSRKSSSDPFDQIPSFNAQDPIELV
jgi:uncharacterized protein involved in copper resistance